MLQWPALFRSQIAASSGLNPSGIHIQQTEKRRVQYVEASRLLQATVGVGRARHVFSEGSSPEDIKVPPPKNWFGKRKTVPDEQSHGLGIQQKSCKNKKTKFRRFRVKEPRHSENKMAKKRYTSHRRTRTAVEPSHGRSCPFRAK